MLELNIIQDWNESMCGKRYCESVLKPGDRIVVSQKQKIHSIMSQSTGVMSEHTICRYVNFVLNEKRFGSFFSLLFLLV